MHLPMRSMVALFVLLGVLGAAAAVGAQWTQRIDLGGGLAVERTWSRGARASTALGWVPTGFVFGDAARPLAFARTFARVPATGRVLAVSGPDAPWPARLLRTDDGGAHWRDEPWDGGALPTLFAFDDLTQDGVAAGDGHVWSTGDGGDHWRDHGGDTSIWTALAIADGVTVLADSLGNVFRSSDGGFARETVSTGSRATLEQRDREIVVHTATADCVARRGSPTRCTAR